MAWAIKTVAFLVAIMLFGVGAWPLSLLVLAVLFAPMMLRSFRKNGTSSEAPSRKGKFPVRYLAAGLLFLLALLGFAARGTYSPVVFGALGFLVLFWGRLKVHGLALGMAPIEETVLLRSRLIPISWAAVAQVKPLTRDMGKALAGLKGTILVVGPAASVYVVVRKTASSERSAQKAILETLREMSASLLQVGAYLLPLDASQAFELLRPSTEPVKFIGRLWSNAVTTSSFDAVLIEQEGGFAKALGLLKRTEGGSRSPSASFAPQALERPPFLMELYKELGTRLTWPQPDQVTAFLSSLSASKGEPLGARFLELETASETKQVSVRSVGGPPVELSRAQLRAVATLLGTA